MQKYAPNTTTAHHRSISLCNYDELCRTRPMIHENIKRRQLATDYDNDAQQDDHEICPLNSSETSKHNFDTTINNKNVPIDHNISRVSTLPSLQNSSTSDVVKLGHRRTLSLRQQFECGYDFLVNELAGKTTKTVSQAWKVCHFSNLPKWMQDNEYLHNGYRPPLPTFRACFKSIFRLHTETGNIWTHGLGALLFIGLFIYEFLTLSSHKNNMDRLMLTIYFCGIITCLLFSCLFHTLSCYSSPKVIKIFSKLDYCGISLQIIGSMTPALYYGFYEDLKMFKMYISFGLVLCVLSIAVSLWDKFGEPQYRSFRAAVFLCFGLSNVIPGVHWYWVLDRRLLTAYYLFILQGVLYVIGSLLYANRIPERLFPGKCDYMFQSHQIFHVLVVLAAFVHLNGINSMAEFRSLHRHLVSNPTTMAPPAT